MPFTILQNPRGIDLRGHISIYYNVICRLGKRGQKGIGEIVNDFVDREENVGN